jgi:hypothetical protein
VYGSEELFKLQKTAKKRDNQKEYKGVLFKGEDANEEGLILPQLV